MQDIGLQGQGGSCVLMVRELDLQTKGCGFESRYQKGLGSE